MVRFGVTLVALLASLCSAAADWPMFGQNLQNTASVASRSPIDPGKLQVKWVFTTAGDVSARAAVVDGVVYFPDWGGYAYGVDASTGRLIWKVALSSFGLSGSADGSYHSRTSPAVAHGKVYLGTVEGGWLLALDAATGTLAWKTQLETEDPYANVTASPTVAGGFVYTGLISNQETMAGLVPNFACCTARGSVVSVHAATGAIRWKTYTVPPGYNGGGVWGSNMVVDATRGTMFAATGNNYTAPTDPAYRACIANRGTPAVCTSPDNHIDSVIALDMNTGAIKWARKQVAWYQAGVTDGSDNWNLSCQVAPFSVCPASPGPDYDFGSAPNLITYHGPHGPKTILGAGQKSGIYYALDPDTGADIWRTQVGPGSALGGIELGAASDGKRIYVAIANYFGLPSAAGSAGSWAALDPATGSILWQVADPNGAIDLGPLAVVDGVVYAASMAGEPTAPTMFALNAHDGQKLWSFAAGSSVIAGAAVVDGVVYWGSGYGRLAAVIPGSTGNNKFYAFSTHGK